MLADCFVWPLADLHPICTLLYIAKFLTNCSACITFDGIYTSCATFDELSRIVSPFPNFLLSPPHLATLRHLPFSYHHDTVRLTTKHCATCSKLRLARFQIPFAARCAVLRRNYRSETYHCAVFYLTLRTLFLVNFRLSPRRSVLTPLTRRKGAPSSTSFISVYRSNRFFRCFSLIFTGRPVGALTLQEFPSCAQLKRAAWLR